MSHLVQVQGRIYKREGRNGKTRYYYRARLLENGTYKDHRTSLGDNLERAVIEARKLDAEIEVRNRGEAPPREVTLGEFVRWYVGHVRDERKLLGWVTIRVNVTAFGGWLGDKPLRSITRTDIERFMDWRKQTVRPMTVNGALRDVRRMLTVAAGEGCITANPATGIRPLPARPMPIKLPNREDMGRLLGHLEKHNPRLRVLVLFAAATGCRMGEATSLTWDRVNFIDGRITLVRRKVRDELPVKMAGPLKDALWCLWMEVGQPKSGSVFVNGEGVAYNRHTAYNVFKRVAKKLGMGYMALRTFRKLAATVTAEETGDPRIASELLGQTSVTTTERFYLGRGDKARDKGSDTMAGYLAGAIGTNVGTLAEKADSQGGNTGKEK